MVHEHSRQVYENPVKPELKSRKDEIKQAIKELGNQPTQAEVAEYLGVPVHTISGRFGELLTDKAIVIVGSKKVTKETRFGGTYTRESNRYDLAA